MNNRWYRFFLSLILIIPLVIGIIFDISRAEESQEPDDQAEVMAYNPATTGLLVREKVSENARELDSTRMSITGIKKMVDIQNTVTGVGDKLILNQSSAEGGWAKVLEAPPTTTPTPLANLYGVTALGLLAAYEMTAGMNAAAPNKGYIYHGANSTKYLDAAKKTGNYLKGIPAANLLSTDIIFLYGLSKLTSGTEKTQYYGAGLHGIEAFIAAYATADATYNFYNNPDSGGNSDPVRQIKHWNLACWVEAARLYAKNSWAEDLMKKICSYQDAAGGFVYNPEVGVGGVGYVRTASQAKVVEVLKRFYNDTTYKAMSVPVMNGNLTFEDILKNGLAYLKGLQSDKDDGVSETGAFRWGGQTEANGSLTPWLSTLLQDQCYGIQAMGYNFQTTWDNYAAKKGPYWGSEYMLQLMMEANVFVDSYVGGGLPTRRNDRNSEAIQALYFSCKEGDVDRSGKIIAFDALKVLKASVAKETFSYGPEIVAARLGKKQVDTGTKLWSDSALNILKFSVGKVVTKVYSFLDYE